MKTPAGLEQIFQTGEPPELSPGPRPGVMSETEINHVLDTFFAKSSVGTRPQQLLRALALLWHDHLEASHAIAQSIETADGSFVHGIMHRREPDYSNAKYWFRRVGQHAAFPEIALRAEALLDTDDAKDLKTQLVPGGKWDAFAFVDFCERAARLPANNSQHKLARELQRIETQVLLDFFQR